MMQQEIVGLEPSTGKDSTDSLATVSSSAAVSTALPAVSTLPSQFAAATNLSSQQSMGTPSLLSNPPQPLSATLQPQVGSFMSPVLLSGGAIPLSSSVGLTPLPSLTTTSSVGASTGPPPKTGFQPVPHSLQEYEAHTHLTGSPPQQLASAPAASTGQVGVNIFTPTFDANIAPSPYNSPPLIQPSAYTPPPAMGSMHSNSSSLVQLDMPTGQQSNLQPQIQSPQDLTSLLEWIKTNETVNRMMQKAKVGVETVITAMDPQMKDVLYSGGDIDIVVASSKAVKVEPVKDAFQKAFGRATVYGKDSQPSIAPQPVGFSSGIKGSEERISNLRRSGLVSDRQVCVAIESFIVDLQSEQWYDIACVMLSDPVNNITLHTFSQATPISTEYVQQAQSETPADYSLAWSGLSVTVGSVMYRHNTAIDPANWHYHYAGVSRSETLLLAAKQLAYMYKQRLSRGY